MYATVWDNRECARGRVRPQRSRKPRHHCGITTKPRRQRRTAAIRRRPRRFPRFRMLRRVSSVKVECARPFVTPAPGRPGAHATNGRSCCEARALRMLRRVSSAAPGVVAASHPPPSVPSRRRHFAIASWRGKLAVGGRNYLAGGETFPSRREQLARGGSNSKSGGRNSLAAGVITPAKCDVLPPTRVTRNPLDRFRA